MQQQHVNVIVKQGDDKYGSKYGYVLRKGNMHVSCDTAEPFMAEEELEEIEYLERAFTDWKDRAEQGKAGYTCWTE
jgi:hypothetical protein